MGIGAALGPMMAAGKIGASLFGGGGGPGAQPAPPLPAMNPMFHDLPPALANNTAAQVVRGPDGPKPQRIPNAAPRPALVSDRIGPGAAVPKSQDRLPTNQELGERAGYKTEVVRGTPVEPGSLPGMFSSSAAPIQAASANATPKTAVDDLKSARPIKAPPTPMRAPGNTPPPGSRPPMPEKPNFFNKGVDMVRGGVSDLQEKLGETSTNPMFQLGMGLLASGYDGSNPYTNILRNMGGVQPALMAQGKADKEMADDKALKEYMEAITAAGLAQQQAQEERKPAKSRQAAAGARVIRR